MTNKHHIAVKNIALKIMKAYKNIRIQEKTEWEKEFDKWLKTLKK